MNEAKITIETETGTTTKDKEFIFFRDKGEKVTTAVFKQFEFILQDDFGEPCLDPEGKTIVIIGLMSNDLVSKVFLPKPDERGNMERSRVVELINEFDNKLNKDLLQCKFKISFEKNTPSGNDTHLDDIMSYNDILDYVKQNNNNKDGDYWRFRKILSHSLISGKKGKEDGIEIQVV